MFTVWKLVNDIWVSDRLKACGGFWHGTKVISLSRLALYFGSHIADILLPASFTQEIKIDYPADL
jgi:hypothetical protein